MKKFVALLLMVLVFQVRAQTPALSSWGWKNSVVSGLTVTQISFKDWAQGGEDALAWTIRLDGKLQLDDTTFSWGNSYKMSYGQAKIGSQDSRKTER